MTPMLPLSRAICFRETDSPGRGDGSSLLVLGQNERPDIPTGLFWGPFCAVSRFFFIPNFSGCHFGRLDFRVLEAGWKTQANMASHYEIEGVVKVDLAIGLILGNYFFGPGDVNS
jgi:hypothetical protein